MAFGVIPKRRTTGRDIAGWVFDVTTEETINMSADVAKDPIEDGRQLSDHRTRKPVKLTFKGIKTATTIRADDARPARLETAFAELKEIFDRDETIEVVSTFGTFPNMMITSITGAISASKGLIHTFTIALEEIFIARFEEVIVSALVPKKKRISAADAEAIRLAAEERARQVELLSGRATTQEAAKSRLLGESRAVTQKERDDQTQKELDAYLNDPNVSDDEKSVVTTLFAKDPDTAKFLGGR